MTICVGVKVRDCIVFAADSAVSMVTTTSGGEQVVQNIWNHGIKVYDIHEELPIVAMSCGSGNLGPSSISELVKYFRNELWRGKVGWALPLDDYRMQDVATKAAEYLGQLATKNETMEFYVGGYGSDAAFGEIWRFSIAGSETTVPALLVEQQTDAYVLWGGGGSEALNRLVLGRDADIPAFLAKLGVSAEHIQDIDNFAYRPLVDPAMPVRDAINLARFLVDVAKGYSAFAPGANSVGGETDIAIVTRHEGFKWIRRKRYYDVDLNPRGD